MYITILLTMHILKLLLKLNNNAYLDKTFNEMKIIKTIEPLVS